MKIGDSRRQWLRSLAYPPPAQPWFVLRDGSYEPPQDERDNFKYPEDPEQALLVEGYERNKALTLSFVEGYAKAGQACGHVKKLQNWVCLPC